MASAWTDFLPYPLRRHYQERTTLHAIISNTSWLMLERVVELGIRFVVGVWVVRYLGPAHYGIYTFALSFVALFETASTLGLDSIVIRNLARGSHDEGRLLGTTMLLRLAAAIPIIGLIAAIIFSIDTEPIKQWAVLLVAGQLLFQAGNVPDLWFQAKIQSKYVVWIRLGITVFVAGSQVAFILAAFPLVAFLGLVLVQSALTAVGLVVCFRNVAPRQRWTWDKAVAREALRDGWPLLFAAFSVAIYMRMDQVMLGLMLDNEAVGQYGAAVRLSEMWYFIPVALAGSVFPEIVRQRESVGPEQFKRGMQAFYDVMALLGYGIAIPIALLAPWLVSMLLGSEYAPAASILQVHIWAMVFVALGVARSRWLVAENLTRFALVASMLGAGVNVALNLLLIPAFAGLGAAWATLLAQFVAAYFSGLCYRPTRSAFVQATLAFTAPLRLLKRNGRISFRL